MVLAGRSQSKNAPATPKGGAAECYRRSMASCRILGKIGRAVLACLKAWFKERRRRRPEREALDLADLLRQTYGYARYDRFLSLIVAHHSRKGYITPKQAKWLPSTIRRAYWTYEGA